MKILLISILYFISGLVNCADVIGYAGGSVIIFSNIKWYSHDSKYICKVEENDCTDIIRADTKRGQIQNGKIMIYANTNHIFLVLIRKLKPQDAGTYRFGLGNQSNFTVNLKVHGNASCGVPKIMSAYLGQNITITCNYPGEYERHNKYVYTVDDNSFIKDILDTNTKFQNGRFSISDDRSAKVFSVNISNVTEADEVFYLLGVWKEDGPVTYYTFFTEMFLHVTELSTNVHPTTGSYVMTSAVTETLSAECFSSSAISITVCICVIVILIGGFALMMIYKLRHKRTQDCSPSPRSKDDKQVTADSK